MSFNRPYGYLGTYYGIYDTAGGSLFANDYNMIRWLEKEGYNVKYCTDIDTHTNVVGLDVSGRQKAFLSVGHNEYWSWNQRHNVETARDRTNSQPLNLGFFTGNTCYWQVRYDISSPNSAPAGAANRTLIGFKEQVREALPYGDPYYHEAEPTFKHLITNQWRRNQTNGGAVFKSPEDELIGVMWQEDDKTTGQLAMDGGRNPAILDPDCPTWIKRNMTFQETLDNLVGQEADRIHNSYNHQMRVKVGTSPFYRNQIPDDGRFAGNSHMTFYTRNGSNAKVFATGTIQWSWGLDNWGADSALGPVIPVHPPSQKSDAQTMTRNVLGCLINNICS